MSDSSDHDPLHASIAEAADLLRQAECVAVLTGAGISAESGVATFRGAGGLWEGHRLEDVATPEAFQRDPALVWRFYNARRANLRSVQPNPGHYALADLENRFGDRHFALITQNVDGLHRAAGSRHVLELHGSLRHLRCSHCTFLEDRGTEPQEDLPPCPECGHLLRPAVVWFGEVLPQDAWIAAEQAARECDCFLVIGTSAIVWPAAGLIVLARDSGASVIEINIQQTDASALVDVHLSGPSGKILPRIVEKLKSD